MRSMQQSERVAYCISTVHYFKYASPFFHNSTRKQLLLERIVPPKFDPKKATTRNTQGRPFRNPTNIRSWDSFRDDGGILAWEVLV